ncbi:GAF domain-containing SpoIIE family protein phosphatase [Reichenbachiella versicolor]|uniref:GAF domain-containing SpoIIE family protein phosphatase n=1 Tax=Reichenbachiella versicolor TaxID=1821036 RepID=UPI001FE98461|nr:PP2C family protein-serine/threonine phosphatase [Reichenbachiella versicolor]
MAAFSEKNEIAFGLPNIISNLLLAFFICAILIYYRYSISKAESVNFVDLLWKVFVFGLVTTIVTLVIEFFFNILDGHRLTENSIIINFFYHINMGLIIGFVSSTYVVWKRLILYQKTKSLLATWQIYEYLLLATLIYDLFFHHYNEPSFIAIYAVLGIIGLVLSFNLKWIAYLNFKQKWRSLLFILLVVVYIWYFVRTLMFYSDKSILIRDLLDNVFILSMITFIVIYAAISFLVILFNLPTTSVFERKLDEAVSFQRLSQSIPAGESEEKVYEILMESATSAVFSEAAWIEIRDESKNINVTLTDRIEKTAIPKIKSAVESSRFKKILNSEFDQNNDQIKLTANIKHPDYKSVLQFPVNVKGEKIGKLVLLKEVNDGFNKEMIDIIDTFVNQANVSIENFRLLQEALTNERYQEELKIANRVQRQLLPDKLVQHEAFDIHAFTQAADEVGGDYYDIFELDDHRTALIIGDVSGKGTSAAFHMAQMKGIFHSLVHLDLNPEDFMVYANDALSRCLEQTSFITVSYFVIDSQTNKATFARAGHCPSLFYSAKDSQASYFKNKGLGLGILRNSKFHNYVQVNEFEFAVNDVLVLYTDGITEATNKNKEQYGSERLLKTLTQNAELAPEAIQQSLINDLYSFCEEDKLSDDYTLLILKFRK